MARTAICIASYVSLVASQQPAVLTPEENVPLTLQYCTNSAGCQKETLGLTLDASWRWIHDKDGYQNCWTGKWDQGLCPDMETCKQKCAIEGVTIEGYSKTYGVKNLTDGVKLEFVSKTGNVGSRLYVTDGNESYKIFQLLNREFTMDVDVATLGCGLNGAAYFIEMDIMGGKGKDGNEAGAKYGTGYCDAQCPKDRWNMNQTNHICCVEMDIWEANKHAAAFTTHPCDSKGPVNCDGVNCDLCDKDGCDFNSYRMGAHNFYGDGIDFEIDTSAVITVVTQFITHDGTDNGTLSEIRRIYLQDDKLIQNVGSAIPGVEGSSLTEEFCHAAISTFSGGEDGHAKRGGLRSMSAALKRGMVLSLSIWDDTASQMRWLDSTYPPKATNLGASRGPCDGHNNQPDHVRHVHRDAYVKYSNIKYGEIGTTFKEKAGRRLEQDILV